MIALISGINGMDGSYLAEILLEKGYEVHGIIRRSSNFNTQRIAHLREKLILHYGDILDSNNINELIRNIKPDEIYHLAAQSHVKVSFELPMYTVNSIVQGTLNILEAIRQINPKIKMYNAASSEMFGDVVETPQRETTPFNPQSPYACSKVFAYNITKNYRKAYNLFACNGILFNHSGERRGNTFVSKKITNYVKYLKHQLDNNLPYELLHLGNIEAKRDWGYAKDYTEMMYMMLQHYKADDYVIATGETHTVKEFCVKAFDFYGFDYEKYIKIDERLFRPTEVNLLKGDATKAKDILGWSPKVKFNELIKIMLENE